MSSIACYSSDKGMRTSGSDRAFDEAPAHPMQKTLEAHGIEITAQDGSHPMPDDSLMVVSAAVEPGRPEVLRARELGVPILSRGD